MLSFSPGKHICTLVNKSTTEKHSGPFNLHDQLNLSFFFQSGSFGFYSLAYQGRQETGRHDEQVGLWLKGKSPEFINVSGISNKLEATRKDVRIINLASKYILPLPSGEPPGIICLLFIIRLHYSTALFLLNGLQRAFNSCSNLQFLFKFWFSL